MLKTKLFFLFSFTLFAVASTILDVFNYNPYRSGLSEFINFYISFGLAIIGILSILFFAIKAMIHQEKVSAQYLVSSIRQASLVSIALTSLMILKGLRILDWWVGIPLVISIILLELFFRTVSQRIDHDKKIKKGNI